MTFALRATHIRFLAAQLVPLGRAAVVGVELLLVGSSQQRHRMVRSIARSYGGREGGLPSRAASRARARVDFGGPFQILFTCLL